MSAYGMAKAAGAFGVSDALAACERENERLKAMLSQADSNSAKFQSGYETEVARIDAAMDLLATRHTSNPQCYYCRELIAERAEIRKALRGEK